MSEDQAPALTRVDVSNEAVERTETALRMNGHHDKAATLRALAAQRDELLAALEQARDGLRYWEPQTQRGLVEFARITTQVDVAIARARGGAA